MADSRGTQHNQEGQYGKENHWTGEDFAACASANANYCYQMSLWWWNTYMHYLHARTQPWASQFADQNCECVERGLILEDDCECYQNDDGTFESQIHQMNSFKDYPQLYPDPPWQRLQEEYSNSSGYHHDLRFGQNNDSDKDNDEDNYGDNCPGGDEDCDDQIDGNDDDDDECDDNSNDNDDHEDSYMKMEVDDDFRKFLEQSEKHRQEREQSKLSIKPFRAKCEQRQVSPHNIDVQCTVLSRCRC